MKKWFRGKRVLLLLALFFCSAVSGWAWWRPAQRFEVSVPKVDELRLVTWNVGYFAPVKNKNAKDLDVERIAEVLQPLQAQVVVLQELNSVQQAEDIARKLGSDWCAKTVETGHDQILAVLSSLVGVEVETRTAGGRSMIGVGFQGEDDRDVFILGVHSPHPARGMDDTVDNIKGAVAWMCERNEAIRIMAGDLNYNFDSDLTVEGDVLYREVMSVLSDGTVSIGETYYAHTRIDHVFHHPQGMKVMEQSSGMVDLKPRFAMVPGWRDHRPVVTTYDVGDF